MKTPLEYHAEMIAVQNALEGLYHNIALRWPLPSQTPQDLADEILRLYQRKFDPPKRDIDDKPLIDELL